MRAVIFGNAEISNYNYIKKLLLDSDTIICCDGGIRHCIELCIKPNYIIGDFDSATKKELDFYKNQNIEFITFPKEKNFTDMELCIDFVSKREEKELLIFGGIGSRFDHSLANANMLRLALDNKINTKLINENNIVQLINDEIILNGNENDIISLIPLTTKVTGITTYGLYYPLFDETIYVYSSRGVSNKMTGNKAKVTIKEGLLFVIQTFDLF